MAKGWVTNLQETEEEGRRLFGDKLLQPALRGFAGARPSTKCKDSGISLAFRQVHCSKKSIPEEMSSNPDEEWQAKRNEDIASFLPKGHAGNWQRLFTARDKAIFKEVAGEMLVKWKYEANGDW